MSAVRCPPRVCFLLSFAAGLAALPAAAATFKGPKSCRVACHKDALASWDKRAPFHKNSLDQLDAAKTPNAKKYAAALGLATPADAKGRCVQCHTTAGLAGPVGVSCESCHGAASDYLTPHSDGEDFFKKPATGGQRLGLLDLFDNARAVAKVCVDCHVTPDAALRMAGHPSGEKFDFRRLKEMTHWPSGDTITTARTRGYKDAFYASVAAAASPLVAQAISRGGGAAPAAKSAAPPPALTPPKPSATTAVAAPQPPPKRAAPVSASASSLDDLLNAPDIEDVPLTQPTGGEATAGRAPAKPIRVSTAVEAPTGFAEPPTAARSPEPTSRPTPETSATATLATPTEPRPATDATRPPADVIELRGRAAALLARLLKERKGALEVREPVAPGEFEGSDGELLRIQDEALYLALKALQKP